MEEPPILDVYNPATMEKLASQELTPPTGGHYYIWAIGLGVSEAEPG